MIKRILLIIIPLLLIAAGVGYYLYTERGFSFNNQSVLDAITVETPAFIQVNDVNQLTGLINSSDSLFEAFFSIKTFSAVKSEIQKGSQLLSENQELIAALAHRPIVITFNIEGKKDVLSTYLIQLINSSESDLIIDLFNTKATQLKYTVSKREYDTKTIYEAITENQNRKMALSIEKGIAIFSTSTLQVENAIRQLSEVSITASPDFQKIRKTAGDQSLLNLYINHRSIDRLLSIQVSERLKSKLVQLKSFSNWSEIDINSTKNKLMLSGFTNASNEENYFANVLIGQKPITGKTDDVLPQQTAYYISLKLSDFKLFQQSYSHYLNGRGIEDQRTIELNRIKQQSGSEIINLFEEMFDNEATWAGISNNDSISTWKNFFIMKVKSGSVALEKMKQLQSVMAKKTKSQEGIKLINIDQETSFEIVPFPISNIAELLFGQSFKGLNSNYVSLYNNYLIFSSSEANLIPFFQANRLGETLGRNMDYMRFQSGLTSKNNLIFFANNKQSLSNAHLIFKQPLADEIQMADEMKKFSYFSWQFSAAGDRIYNNACFEYIPNQPIKQKTVWQFRADYPFQTKPFLMLNPNDKRDTEILVQDNQQNLYLINSEGRLQWKLKLDGAIMGDIQQVEAKRNGALQYLLNTKSSIYLIDHAGNNASGFPVLLNNKATSPIAAFDYDQNQTYRIFVSCEDKRIHAYTTSGEKVDGWEAFQTDYEVYQQLKHFRIDGKDFLVAADAMKDYILDRRGNIRVKTDAVYTHNTQNELYLEERTKLTEPRFVTTDQQGNLHYTNFNGEHTLTKLDSLNEQHFFVALDITNDDAVEYIITQGNRLKIFDTQFKLLLNKEFDSPITDMPVVYKLPSGKKEIGIICAALNRIYLIGIDGQLHQGFPLEGNQPFSILIQPGETNRFNVYAIHADGQLNNYAINK